MAYIRNKKIKGIDYAYLVQSKWDSATNTSKQITIKYLGKSSKVSIEDIPDQYKNNPKIVEFVSGYRSTENLENVLVNVQDEMFNLLKEYSIDGLLDLYNRQIQVIGLVNFYDKLLKPVLYKIGDLWEKGELDVATEHACSNAANSMIKIINKYLFLKRRNKKTIASKSGAKVSRVMVCTPEGELHNLQCSILESLLIDKGYYVYNISPSVPVDSTINYLRNTNPDLMIISVTLEENIKSALRLVNKICLEYDKKIPILIGGAAFNLSKVQKDDSIVHFTKNENISLTKALSFKDIIKSVDNALKIAK